jgi:hypothetical protein
MTQSIFLSGVLIAVTFYFHASRSDQVERPDTVTVVFITTQPVSVDRGCVFLVSLSKRRQFWAGQ